MSWNISSGLSSHFIPCLPCNPVSSTPSHAGVRTIFTAGAKHALLYWIPINSFRMQFVWTVLCVWTEIKRNPGILSLLLCIISLIEVFLKLKTSSIGLGLNTLKCTFNGHCSCCWFQFSSWSFGIGGKQTEGSCGVHARRTKIKGRVRFVATLNFPGERQFLLKNQCGLTWRRPSSQRSSPMDHLKVVDYSGPHMNSGPALVHVPFCVVPVCDPNTDECTSLAQLILNDDPWLHFHLAISTGSSLRRNTQDPSEYCK